MIYTNKLLCLFLFLAELNTYISGITNTEGYSLIGYLIEGPKVFIGSSLECSKVCYFIGFLIEGASGFVVAAIRDFSIHIFNNLFIFDFLFELNFFCVIGFIGMILLITVIILIGSRILASKPINEGIKTVINLGVCALTGIALANAANGRDEDDERRRREEAERQRAEEQKRADEERKRVEEQQRAAEEQIIEETNKTENDKKGKGW